MTVNVKRGSAEAIKEIIKLRKGISVDEMVEIERGIATAGGSLVGIDGDDGDWCGNGRIHIPIPIPKPNEFVKFLDLMAAKRINFEVLINGIPVPDHILMTVSRHNMRF